jgi:hypothetical protein
MVTYRIERKFSELTSQLHNYNLREARNEIKKEAEKLGREKKDFKLIKIN